MVTQGEMTRLRSLVRQKESEVEQVNEVATKLNRERDNISDIVRQEFADRYVLYHYLCISLPHIQLHVCARTHALTHTYTHKYTRTWT